MSPIEVVAWPAVFIAGIAIGFTLGVRYQHHKLTREVVMETQALKAWWRKRWTAIVGLFCIAMALLTYQSAHDSNRASETSTSALREVQAQSACLTSYANQLYDSLTPRQHAFDRLQRADRHFKRVDQKFAEALGKLLSDALGGKASEATRTQDAIDLQHATEAKARALAHANDVSDRLDRKRAQNPYPLPPKAVCPK